MSFYNLKKTEATDHMQYGCHIFPHVLPDRPIKSALCQYTRIMAISYRKSFALVTAEL